MEIFLTSHESAVRLAAFAGLLALFAAAETLWPRRGRAQVRTWRWATNLGMSFLNTAALRVLVPVLAVDMALRAQAGGFGLFNVTGTPAWLAFVISLLLLDLAVYWQHWAFHRIPVLWRLHGVHHTDRDVDATTALRFHPVEILISMGIKVALVAALGAPAGAVILFEVVLNGMAMFNHANMRLPSGLDRVLRLLVVTPDMHRVHHSVIPRETNSNFGFNLSLWDRLFGTYRAQPEAGHDRMTIGLAAYQDERPQWLGFALVLPLKGIERTPEGKPETRL